MADQIFANGKLVLPDRIISDQLLVIRDGRILEVGEPRRVSSSAQWIDAAGGYLVPGFIDLHVHGGDGADVMDGTAEAVATVCRAHLRHGTTTIVPTSTTGPPEEIQAFLSAVAEVRQTDLAAVLPGVHLYGPYFAPEKVGCHSKSGCREPSASEYAGYLATGLIKIATCAAELPGAIEFYRAARSAGCLVTCGHSNSSWNEMQQAFAAGMRHVDHFWCAMSSISSLRSRFGTPMQGSMAEFVLMNPEMSTEVIADGHHLAPELLEFAYRMLGPQRLCLVTDCNRALDMPPGKYRFGHQASGTWFESDGAVGWAPDGNLASSVRGMDHMVQHMQRVTSATLPEIIRMATLTPAERLGMQHEIGSLEPGKRANLLLLDEQLRIQRVFVAGQEWT